MDNRGVVLLSGGLDSTAALVWATARYTDLRAFAVDYGQPNRDQELTAAGRAAEQMGAPYVRICVADTLRPSKPRGLMAEEYGGEKTFPGSTDRAFVPGRNVIFATAAAAHAACWWPDDGPFDIIMGACAEDQAGFHDCRPANLAKVSYALSACIGREITIRSPWADMTKSQILYAVSPSATALDLVARSYSCYRPDGPCGQCGACVKRRNGFVARGLADLSRNTKMTGGDPSRAVR